MWVVIGCPFCSHSRNQTSSIICCHHLNLWQGKRESERKNLTFNCLGLEIKYFASTLNSLAWTSHMVPNQMPGRLGIVETILNIRWALMASATQHPLFKERRFSQKTKGATDHKLCLLSICNHPRDMDVLMD